MKRFFLGMAVLLIALIGGWLGTAYWAGTQAQQLYRRSIQESSQDPTLKITSQEYQRGLLFSEAVSRITLQGTPPDPATADGTLTFSLKHDIYHGILPIAWWLRGDFKPRPLQAVVHTVLSRDAPWNTVLTELFGEREPLTVVSYVALDGSSDNDVTIPYLDLTHRLGLHTINFSGLEGRIHAAPLGRAVKGELSAAALYALISQELGSSIRLTDLRLSVDQQRGRFDFMTGDSALNVATFATSNLGDAAGTLTLTGLLLRTHVQEQGELVNSTFAMAVDDVNWNQTAIGSGQFKLSANKLDGAILERLQQWNREHRAVGVEPPAVQELLGLLPALLQRNPELLLTAEANAPQGELRGNAQIVFQNPEHIALYNPARLLSALSRAEARLTISKALLETSLFNILKAQVVAAAIREGQEPDDDQVTAAAQLQTQQQLAQLLNTRWLRLENDIYEAQARFEQGRFYLNGIELPLPF
jgi:uncharacterized protein YdgA (DUF945 family)